MPLPKNGFPSNREIVLNSGIIIPSQQVEALESEETQPAHKVVESNETSTFW